MAQLVNRIVYLGIFLISLTELGSALRIVSEPEPYSDWSEKINITCVPGGPTKSIISILIMKQNGPTIAVIDDKQGLTMGAGSRDNMKAEGHVDTADASKSHLTLTIEKPGRQDAGIYRCRVFFTDKTYNIVQDNVIGNVTYQETDITGIVQDLAQKVQKQNTKIQKQNNEMTQLKSEINQQKTKIDYLTKENNQHKTMIDDNQQQIRKLELQVKNLAQELRPTSTTPPITTTSHSNTTASPATTSTTNRTGCPDGWTFYKGDRTCLKVFDFDCDGDKKCLDWFRARKSCQTFGGDLVIIRDEEKNNFVYKMTIGIRYTPWIGLRNHGSRGFNFKYVDGSDLGSYHSWSYGYPYSDEGPDRNCVYMNTTSWRQGYCGEPSPYICSI